MFNGSSRIAHKRESIAARVMVALATLAAGVVLLRALPDIVRYLRVRRM
jgi:hypothetical protein